MLSTATVADTGNVLVDALTWGTKWMASTGPLQIRVGFKLIDGLLPTLAETAAVKAVLAEFERVINVDFDFIGVDHSNAADLTFQIANDVWDTSYGWSLPPGEAREAPYGDINILRNNFLGTGTTFDPGSFDYITFVHEFAHVMGLAHPHDNGGRSGIFPGVTGTDVIGQFGLNQGVFTTMTYNDGIELSHVAPKLSFWLEDEVTGRVVTGSSTPEVADPLLGVSYGLQGGLMALDILTLQALYGANTDYASTDTQYFLPTLNAPVTAYLSIWDTGGIDTISAPGNGNARIDLRAASGQVAEGGGGFLSSIAKIHGGFTIASGVTIENAISGSGDDHLFGNAAANILYAGVGADVLTGFGGKDELWGGDGNDRFVFLSTLDSGPTILSADVIKDFNANADVIDLSEIDANGALAGNQSFRFLGSAASFLEAGELRVGTSAGNTVLYLNTDADMSSETVIVLSGLHTLSAGDFLL
jgi:serralysin